MLTARFVQAMRAACRLVPDFERALLLQIVAAGLFDQFTLAEALYRCLPEKIDAAPES